MRTAQAQAAASDDRPRLADRLRDVRAGTRNDLAVVRHVLRGEPAYVVRDPLTFQSHRFDVRGYAVFVALGKDRSLGRIFGELVERGVMADDDEEEFYRTVFLMHRLNFLSLPVADGELLYERYLAGKRARWKEKLLGILFLRLPVWNPDAFLNRTQWVADAAFGKAFFLIWLAIVGAAGFVAARDLDRLIQPVEGLLAARNLPIVLAMLIGLKIVHEFGHAYACKRFGGHVPEMGVFLVVFTPLAYVDATAAWGFARKRDRLLVCLAGMYFELLLTALAVFVWAATGPGLIHDTAYNVVFLAGVTTVLFNVNPLMRFDGYYALSDLVEVPNLRQQSTRTVLALLARVLLGVRPDAAPKGIALQCFLLTFGVAASLYRVSIILAISAAIAAKLFLVGVGIAVVYVGATLARMTHGLGRYLFVAPETAPVRVRAAVIGLALFVGVPVAVVTVSIPNTVSASGILGTERETVVHAGQDGFVARVGAEIGQTVTPGQILVELANDTPREALAEASAQLDASNIRYDAYQVLDLGEALQEKERAAVYRTALRRCRAEVRDLSVRAENAGRVVECIDRRNEGLFIRKGDPLATVASGAWLVRAMLTEREWADAKPQVGNAVRIRASARPDVSIRGRIRRIVPKGSRTIAAESLTQVAGGDIAVDPNTSKAPDAYFEVVVELLDAGHPWLRHGMTCQVRCNAESDTIGTMLERRCRRFLTGLMRG